MSTEVQVTTTPATILRHAVELAEPGPVDETRWDEQARTLGELGYALVPAERGCSALPEVPEQAEHRVRRGGPAFGATVTNTLASPDNPHRVGLFVRAYRRRGRSNPGVWWEITDARGAFWHLRPVACHLGAEPTGGQQ